MKSIHVLRKPCSEQTVAANVLRHGTGALNVDSCRVGVDTDRAARYGGRAPKGGGNIAFAGARPEPCVVLPGRWPANLVLQHLDGCRQEGTTKVKVIGATAHRKEHRTHSLASVGTQSHEHAGFRDPDGTETVAAWACAPGCPVAALDAQSGELRARGNTTPTKRGSEGIFWAGNGNGYDSIDSGDTGGASRFFKQVKS